MRNGNRLSGIALIVAVMVSPSFGGFVTFTPPSYTVTAGTPIYVDLKLTVEIVGDLDFAYILIGSNDPHDLNLTLHQDWTDGFSSYGVLLDSEGIYSQEVLVDGNNSPIPLGLTSLNMGELVIDTTGMDDGPYTVEIHSGESQVGLIGGEEPIFEGVSGTFEFTIIPEPAMLSLLALGGLFVAKRRR